MGNVLSTLHSEDDKSSTMSNRQSNMTALEGESPEAEGLPESEGLPKNSMESRIGSCINGKPLRFGE